MSQRRTRLGWIAAAAVKSASALAVGACLAVGVGAGVARAATPPDPLKSWSVAHIEATSIANAEQAPSLTLNGSFEQAGKTTTLKLGIKKGHGCTATLVSSLGTEKIIVIGKTVYLYLDKKFWTSADGSAGASLYAEIKGRYLKVSSASLAKSLTPLCSVQQNLTSSGSKVTMSRGKVSTLDGVRVLELKNSDGSDIYVTDSSKPEIFEMTSPKGSAGGAGTLKMNVGVPVTLAAPPASDVVNGARYGF